MFERMLYDMSSIEDAIQKTEHPIRWLYKCQSETRRDDDSRRSVDRTQVPWFEVEADSEVGSAERKAARTRETIPVPAPTWIKAQSRPP